MMRDLLFFVSVGFLTVKVSLLKLSNQRSTALRSCLFRAGIALEKWLLCNHESLF